MNAKGKTIRLYLVDGSPLGIISAEIINWTGKILSFPRGLLPEALRRKEFSRTGIYFLIGPDPNNPHEQIVYVGKSDNIANRLQTHENDEKKGFFEHVILFISKDENLTAGHASYLENRLIGIIRSVGLAKLANGNDGSAISLPESEISDMEFVIQQLRVLLPALGFNFLRELPKQTEQSNGSESSSNIFELNYLGDTIKAQAYEAEGQMVVLKGSTARHPNKVTPSMRPGYLRQINALIEQKKLVAIPDSEDILKFAVDVGFSSPSAASDLICGSSTNGKIAWKIKGSNKSYGEWLAKRMPSITQQEP